MALINGIHEYTEADTVSPTFSELLNLLGDSVRDRLAALEAAMPARVQSGVVTVNAASLSAGNVGVNQAFTFPVAFPGGPRVVVQRVSTNTPVDVAVWGVSASGFSLTPRNASSTTATPAGFTVAFHWIAVWGA